jgi:hypothetical protein
MWSSMTRARLLSPPTTTSIEASVGGAIAKPPPPANIPTAVTWTGQSGGTTAIASAGDARSRPTGPGPAQVLQAVRAGSEAWIAELQALLQRIGDFEVDHEDEPSGDHQADFSRGRQLVPRNALMVAMESSYVVIV